MLYIDSIQNGLVIDHIKAGTSMRIYHLLRLDRLDCGIAIIKNVRSAKYERTAIIKIEGKHDQNLDILGYLDPNITIVIIKDGKVSEKKSLTLPKTLTNVIRCSNPRCITSAEEGIDHIFVLSEKGRYRCIYCDEEFHPSLS